MSGENRELKKFAPTLVLLVLAVLINYVDRGSLSLAVPELKVEWSLSATQLGILLSSFFWTYTLLQSAIGWLVDRYGANLVMTLGLFVWSLATATTGLATGFAMLLSLRLLLGIGESVVFPASSKILAEHLSEHSRGFANSLICAAMRWGTAVGTFGGGFILARYGWRATFVVLGLVGLMWLPAWMRWKPTHAESKSQIGREGTPTFKAILQKRSFWGAAMGHFSANYLAYFLMSWLPYYLVHERHLSIASMVGTAGILYSVDSVCAIATGWISDRRILGGVSPTVVRKWAMGIGFSVAAAALAACAVAGSRTYMACLVGTAVGCGIANANVFAIAQTLAGPRGAGRWVGLQNCIANFAGISGPALTGFIIDWTGHFGLALAVVALVTLGGGVAWVFVVQRIEETRWKTIQMSAA